jgi:hypothetical protein
MRTTLDVDDEVLEAVKHLARAEKRTSGQVLSDLVRQSLSAVPAGETEFFGFRPLPRRGVVVTKELVQTLIDEDEA